MNAEKSAILAVRAGQCLPSLHVGGLKVVRFMQRRRGADRPGLAATEDQVVSRACFINGRDVRGFIAQGLKPLTFQAIFGTTKVVP